MPQEQPKALPAPADGPAAGNRASGAAAAWEVG